jgi:ATP-binding cassette subfamily B protein
MNYSDSYVEEAELGKTYDFKILKRLWMFTKPYRKWIWASLLLLLAITAIDLSVPYLTRIAIDQYILPKGRELSLTSDIQTIMMLRHDDLAGIGRIAMIFLILTAAGFVFEFFQVLVMEYAGQMMMHDLRLKIFSHLQSLSLSFFNRNPIGRLVTRATNDVQNMHELFTSVIAFVFKDIILIIGITVVLLALNRPLAIASFIVVPIVYAASIHFSAKARELFRKLKLLLARINIRFSETIGGIKVIQLFLQERENFRNFETLNRENYLTTLMRLEVFAVFLRTVGFLGTFATALVMFYGGMGVLADDISVGVLVAFLSYMKIFFRPIQDIAEKYNILQDAMASAERIFLILDNAESIPQPENPAKLGRIDSIELRNLWFAYNDNEYVLKNVSFKVQGGQTIAIVGPTGSGKTSIIHLLMRFYEPGKGQILINGQDMKNISAHELRAGMSLVSQDPFLFSENIFHNIFQDRKDVSEEEINEVLLESNCKNFIDRLPDGIHTELSEGGASISSGERQLISIARAFARNPDVIILDEATSYVDSETEAKIQDALSNLTKNRTTIIIAHRLSTVRNADNIIVLHQGRVIESGTHDELMRHQGFYFRLNQMQR